MLNKTSIKLNKSWVCEHLSDVTAKDIAWVLLQEPGFIGFGMVQQNNICFPPCVEPDWTLTSDLRLFGEKGEWHVWRDWDSNHCARLRELENIDDTLTEYHALWGTQLEETDTHPWIKVVEDRGTEIWLPLAKSKLNAKLDLPLRLKLKQIIDYDPKYHLAGIVDAALIGLVRGPNAKKDDELLLPTDLLPCS